MAGTDGAVGPDGGPEGVLPPEPPALPELTPCPSGYREVSGDGGLTWCDPWPESGFETCGDFEVMLPGEGGCRAVGSACPSGPFAEGLPVDATVLYVSPGGTGDGTLADPFGSIGRATGRATAGTVIALASGTYDAVLQIPADVTVWGACPSRTTVTSSVASTLMGVLHATGPGARATSLSVLDSARGGATVMRPDHELFLDGVVFARTYSIGIDARGGRLDADDVLVRDTRPTSAGLFGRAMGVQDAGTATLRRAELRGNRDTAIAVLGESSMTMERVVAHGTMARAGGTGGNAVNMGFSTTTIDESVFEGQLEAALIAAGEGAVLTVEDTVVRDTGSRPLDLQGGRAVGVTLGAVASIRRSLFERNREHGIFGDGEGTVVTADDTIVRDTEGFELDGTFGRALSLQHGVTGHVRRAVFEGNREVAFFAADGVVADVEDLIVRDTRPLASDDRDGRAMMVGFGARVDVTRAVLERNLEAGIVADAVGTELLLASVVIRDTAGERADGTFGRGLILQNGARAEVTRALVEGNRDVGIHVIASGALSATHVRIADTMARDCAETTCPDEPAGHALGVTDSSRAQLTDFELSGSNLCGVLVALGSEVDLQRGRVADNAIGACVQVGDYDLSRLMDDVRYVENGVSLDATDLPIPESVNPIGG
jgi:hypothetical protein